MCWCSGVEALLALDAALDALRRANGVAGAQSGLAHRPFGVLLGLLCPLASGLRRFCGEFRRALRGQGHRFPVSRGLFPRLNPRFRLGHRRVSLAGQARDLRPEIGLFGVLEDEGQPDPRRRGTGQRADQRQRPAAPQHRPAFRDDLPALPVPLRPALRRHHQPEPEAQPGQERGGDGPKDFLVHGHSIALQLNFRV